MTENNHNPAEMSRTLTRMQAERAYQVRSCGQGTVLPSLYILVILVALALVCREVLL